MQTLKSGSTLYMYRPEGDMTVYDTGGRVQKGKKVAEYFTGGYAYNNFGISMHNSACRVAEIMGWKIAEIRLVSAKELGAQVISWDWEDVNFRGQLGNIHLFVRLDN